MNCSGVRLVVGCLVVGSHPGLQIADRAYELIFEYRVVLGYAG